ncbi:Dabb family protein [Acetobacter fallax]|uniref:Dabb family protein n=1 Tax=Acetobacter fallax TaxID=1737473 RepID=A0ABX0KDH2_9PROT|nr:Dabb family protein [Acetobacter fallax]NHO32520.1 Dabb family protein [Acetobacter fallax]NHO36136.1 Dabb family protein [Acetobacter fallax]
MKHSPLRHGIAVATAVIIFSSVHRNEAGATPEASTHAGRPAASGSAAQAATRLRDDVGVTRFTAAGFRPGTVRHMVMFQLRPEVTAAEREEVINGFRDLAKLSKRPDGTLVVQSLDIGVQDSGEGTDLELELGFLVTFRSQGDRNFYVGRPVVNDPTFFDPAHERYKQRIAPFLKQVVVFDFPVEASAPGK